MITLKELQAFHNEKTEDLVSITKKYDSSIIIEGLFFNYSTNDINVIIDQTGKIKIIEIETFSLENEKGFSTFDVHDYIAPTTIGSREILKAEAIVKCFLDYVVFIEDFENKLEIEIEAKKEVERLKRLQKRHRRDAESLMTGILVSVDSVDEFVCKELVNIYFRKTLMDKTKITSYKFGFNHLTKTHEFYLDDAEIKENYISFKNLGKELRLPLFEDIDRFKDDKEWHDEH